MKYFKADENTLIEFDEESKRSTTFDLRILKDTSDRAKIRLLEIKDPTSNAKLLEWAKVNYPYIDYSEERKELEGNISLYEKTKKLLETI